MTGEMIAVLTRSEDALKALARIVTDIHSGRLDDRFKEYLLCSRLFGIPKGGDDVRPIAVGEPLYKLAGLVATRRVAGVARDICAPHQKGIANPGGCESVIHSAQALLKDGKLIAIAIDFINAFNSRDRAQLLHALFGQQQLSSIHRFAHWAYSAPSPLYVYGKDGTVIATIDSSNGVKQGDPLGSLSFAVSVKDIYAAVAEVSPNVTVLAILDDVTLIGPPEDVMKAVKRLEELAKAAGLLIQAKKSVCFFFSDQQLPSSVEQFLRDKGIPIEREAGMLLGAPIGRNVEKIGSLLRNIVAEHESFFTLIKNDRLPVQESMLILRLSGVPRMNYISRCVHPDLTAESTLLFDQQVLDAAKSKLQLPSPVSHSALQQMTSPVKFGGFGLRSSFSTRQFAWWGALAQAAPVLQQVNATPAGIEEVLAVVRDRAPSSHSVLPAEHKTALSFYNSDKTSAVQLQHALTAESEAIEFDETFRDLNQESQARLNAASAPWAGAWITAIPLDKSLQLDNSAYRIAARLRLGLFLVDSAPARCRCGQSFVEDPFHGLSCQFMRGSAITRRHNAVTRIVARYIRLAGGYAEVEPQHLFANTNVRPDIDANLGANREILDISVRHPLAVSHLRSAAREQLSVAKEAEAEKKRNYDRVIGDIEARVTPFVVESLGGFGEKAREFVSRLSKFCSLDHTGWSSHQILYGLSTAAAIAVQRGNADSVIKCFQAARNHDASGVRFVINRRP
jgi:hypothetical protein